MAEAVLAGSMGEHSSSKAAVRLKSSAFLGEERNQPTFGTFPSFRTQFSTFPRPSNSPTAVGQTTPLQCRPVPPKSSEVTPLYQTQRSGQQPR